MTAPALEAAKRRQQDELRAQALAALARTTPVRVADEDEDDPEDPSECSD